MALTDWNSYGDTGTVGQDTQHVYTGSYSLKMANNNNATVNVLGQSETDQPTEAIIDSYWYLGGTNWAAMGAFRFQDTDNLYGVTFHDTNNDLRLYARNNGNRVQAENINTAYWASGNWYRIRMEAYEDGGTFYVRVKSKSPGASTFDTVGTLNDGNNYHSAGGAVGPGSALFNDSPTWWDDTEIFY